jgi:hypothetical protein
MSPLFEHDPKQPIEFGYKCGCTRTGKRDELPQLCPKHRQPVDRIAFSFYPENQVPH